MKDGVDSLFFEMGNKEDLKAKLIFLLENIKQLEQMSKECIKSGRRFLYEHERDKFLKYVYGRSL